MDWVPATSTHLAMTELRRPKRPLIHLVAGARPNFMKIAPLWHALRRCQEEFDVAIVHTGQHYDDEMSDVFLRQFGLPRRPICWAWVAPAMLSRPQQSWLPTRMSACQRALTGWWSLET